jgi:hypothetical protein
MGQPMTHEERSKLIKFIVDAVWEVEGAVIPAIILHQLSDEELVKEADWYDYLLDK